MKLIMCIGLPGSGKSTWALEMVEASGWITGRVNKDDIRRDLEAGRYTDYKNWVWSRDNEKVVVQIRDQRIKEFFEQGVDVISDDTNLAPKHQTRLKELADLYSADFEVKSFMDIPIETCIERDSKRSGKAKVGPEVIKAMANQYIGQSTTKQEIVPYTVCEGLPWAIICDLDGTLSLFESKGHRGPYDASKSDEDEINVPVLTTLRAMLAAGYKLIFMSGREDRFRPQTLTFLTRCGLQDYPLYMRKSGDRRKDCIVKGELFDANVRDKFNVLYCLDDRQQVVDFYRSLGLIVFQVAPGKF